MIGSLAGIRQHFNFYLSLFSLVVVAVIGWVVLILGAGTMHHDGINASVMSALMNAMMAPGEVVHYLVATSLMWIVMMLAMMAPAVIPMVSVFSKLDRGTGSAGDPLLFASGYLIAWCVFSIVATAVQWFLHSGGWLEGQMLTAGPKLAAALLVGAGLYQLTPLKETCLKHCRSPLAYFLNHARDGRSGAVAMGLSHGLFCIGCCWTLMALMFVGGVMSVVAMALLSIFILAERLMPGAGWSTKLPGLILLGWGSVLLMPS